jgi:hypothetical protein
MGLSIMGNQVSASGSGACARRRSRTAIMLVP